MAVGEPASDERLLAAWRAGDRSAGSQLIERHFDGLFRFFQTKIPDHAEDLVQDTLMGCVRGLEGFREQASFRTYLFAIARRKALMFWRTRGRHGTHVDFDSTSVEDLGASMTKLFSDAQEERLLLRALRRIPLEAQILLELFYWEGLTGQALAEIYEAPEGTIRGRLRKARAKLEQQIAELAADPAMLRSTVDNFERWVAAMKGHLGDSPRHVS